MPSNVEHFAGMTACYRRLVSSSRAARRLVGASSPGLLLVPLLLGACAGPRVGETAVPTLASSTDSATAWADIRDSFAHDRQSGAAGALRLRIQRFLVRFPHDELAPLAHIYLANLMIDAGDVRSATPEMDAIGTLPPGNAHDFQVATRARLLRLAGQPGDAMAMLSPLVGKVVDPALRGLVLEELTLAAVQAKRDYEAVAYMDAWLRSAPEQDKDAIRKELAAELARMSPVALEGSLRAIVSGEGGGYSAELGRLLAQRVAQQAIDAQDSKLAQWLLGSSFGASLATSKTGQDLRDLATSLRGVSTVAGRTIGLVLPTANADLRYAAADAARGVAFALNLPRATPDPGAPRLVTRGDSGGKDGLEIALEELAGAGAAVILAGFGGDEPDRARHWSEASGVPVIILGVPKDKPIRFSFVAGEPPDASIALLLGELASRASRRGAAGPLKVATAVGAIARDALAAAKTPLTLLPPVSCEPPLSSARFPTASWSHDHVRDFLAAGPEACTRALSRALPAGDVTLALTLEASGGVDVSTASMHVLTIGAGALPAIPKKMDPRILTYSKQLGDEPTWWTAIGHDAAVLAAAAVAPLPTDKAESATEVTRRREIARQGLVAAKASLWTTDAQAFGDDHLLPRTLTVVELPRR